MKQKFDTLEIGLCAAFSLLVGVALVHGYYARFDGMRGYRQLYQSQVSWNGEEWLIRDFFRDRRNGYFVDVGANHFRDGSNTYFLETALGWSGLAVEPQAGFATDYDQHRPMTRYVQVFVSSGPGTIPFYLPRDKDRHGVAGADPVYVRQAGGPTTTVTVPTTTLDLLLEEAGRTTIDFLSMDIERHEPQALAGFTIGKFRPALVCIEAHEPTRQAILDYFARNDYVLVGKYVRADETNFWFMPLEGAAK